MGNLQLEVLYTPGHTEDSISLLDIDSSLLFSGDFIYPGDLYAFLPNSGMADYLQGADTLLAATASGTRIFGAHRVGPPGAPQLALTDVADLQNALQAIRSGNGPASGFYPRAYAINQRIQLLAEPGWLQNWTARHPEVR